MKLKKKIFFKLDLNFLKLKLNNELDFSKKVKKGIVNFTLNKKNFRALYDMNDSSFIFNLFDNLDNPNFSYKGEINLNPFYSKLEGAIKEINILYLLDSNLLILQFLKTEILNNKNFNFDLNIYSDVSRNFSDFTKINLYSKFQEGLVDIDKTRFSWKDNADFSLEDSLIYIKAGELILDGKLNLTIKNSDAIYKFLLTPKKYRNELKNIKANFVYNFDRKIISLNNIIIDNINNKDVNEILENLIFKKNRLQNRVYLKSILNRALKFYAG